MKSILITGGSGSFGQAFVRRLLGKSDPPRRIIVYSRGEHAQEEMARKYNQEQMRYFIGDVRDKDRLEFAMRDVDTVIHAAALKIVPTAEYNPTECIATNIGGAENVAWAAIRSGVGRVIALSTDKAVNPINLYGASKLAAEKVFLAANNLSAGRCRFSIVRYGNVIGSRGSVLPLFQKLAARGEALPITDTRMTRFWYKMEDAVELVIYALEATQGREIFIPKIPSINIIDLARAISDRFENIGIRPGEKLHECLMTEDESVMAIETEKCFILKGTPQNTLAEGFRYASDTNTNWLTTSQLKASLCLTS